MANVTVIMPKPLEAEDTVNNVRKMRMGSAS